MCSASARRRSLGTGGHLLQAAPETVEVLRLHDVPLDPGLEGIALARHVIPLLVERVSPRVVAVRVRRERAALHDADRPDGPVRQYDGIRRRLEAIDDLLDGYNRTLR